MVSSKHPLPPERTTPGFAFSILDRALRDCLSERKFGIAEIAQVCAFFGGDNLECVYCGSMDVARWDHLVPIKFGGDTVIGNMVPACSRCDDSKRDISYDLWMRGKANGPPENRSINDIEERIFRLNEYQTRFGYHPKELSERLSPEEMKALSSIQSRIVALRKEIDNLISTHRSSKNGPPNNI